MNRRRRALAALVASGALVLASGVAFAIASSAGVGSELSQVTARDAAQTAVSPEPARPSEDVAGDRQVDPQPATVVPDVPVVDATEIVIEQPPAPPRSLSIPGVGVTMPVAATGVADDGQMELPDNPAVIGWYKFGASPGDSEGSTVLGGHVDSIADGIGPLARLASVEVGEQIVVTGADGAPVRYDVTSVQRITKAALPVDVLFAPEGPHQLAVITCGGRYIPDAGGYEDNIVVLAEPVTG